MKKKKFYVVWEGKKKGVFNNWNECKKSIDGHKGASYKSFPTHQEALEAFSKQKPTNLKVKNGYSYNNDENHQFITQLLSKNHIVIFTDGGALGNPGKGGYGAVLQFIKESEIIKKELSGGFRETTNNRMEILAIIKSLQSIKSTSIPINIFSDSKYVVDAVNLGWAKKWQRNNWLKSNKEEAKNIDLWQELLDLIEKQTITFYWVKGHAGIIGNERCDELANLVMQNEIFEIDKYYEEGQR